MTGRITRRDFLRLSGLSVCGLPLCSLTGCGQIGKKPGRHILLITLDTTRADRLHCYGYPKPTSPTLDVLAGSSALFECAISQAAVTPVSHASILTGLNPYHHGLRVLHGTEGYSLKKEIPTLAEIWENAGGASAAFVSAFPVTRRFGLDRGFNKFDEDFPRDNAGKLVSKKHGTVNVGASQRRANTTTSSALRWLEKDYDGGKPLFMWVHYFDPHDPSLLPPEPFTNRFAPGARASSADKLRAAYDAEILFMDDQLRGLFLALDDLGMWNDTVVAVVADHGEGLGDHDWWTHGILYQEQIRVPMMIRSPDTNRAFRVPSLVRTIDLMPTLLELAGIQPSFHPAMDGQSLAYTVRTGASIPEMQAYADSVNTLNYRRPDTDEKLDHKQEKLYCLMTRYRKLIYHQLKPEETEFYNLESDPAELNNLASKKPAGMPALMEALLDLNPFSNIGNDGKSVDPDAERKLRSLGYLH